ncbi:MAG TPA: hypothetical protein VFJ12_07135 [Segeticoccus sp.]|jgi:hypothetical protein|nr:hypothetical protein [Segeticoccus sp.]
MRTTSEERSAARIGDPAPHLWVGAALVGMGEGASRRAEHAARTGRHVVAAGIRIEVLEVYCSRCRVRYSDRTCDTPCTGLALGTAVNG